MATAPRDPSAATTEERVRQRLRELRLANGLTLRQVAAHAHLDVSTLSRLESGKRRLTLDHLPPLADALGVSTDELLTPPRPPDPRVAARPIRRNGLTMWPLNHIGSTHQLQTYKVHIPASRRHPPASLPVHEGHDWMYVLSGRLRLLLGDEDLTIEPGGAVEFTTTTPHWFGAVDGPVEVLAVFGPHGERAHLDPPPAVNPDGRAGTSRHPAV
jgi:transcriptional regulator with XRE-family HTH domain